MEKTEHSYEPEVATSSISEKNTDQDLEKASQKTPSSKPTYGTFLLHNETKRGLKVRDEEGAYTVIVRSFITSFILVGALVITGFVMVCLVFV